MNSIGWLTHTSHYSSAAFSSIDAHSVHQPTVVLLYPTYVAVSYQQPNMSDQQQQSEMVSVAPTVWTPSVGYRKGTGSVQVQI